MLKASDYTIVAGTTAAENDVRVDKLFVDADGVLTEGTLETVTQPAPSISVSSSGLITASYTPAAGAVDDTTVKSSTQQLSAKSAQTYTPTTTDQTISANKYLTGAQTIKGDANLVSANIAEGVTIFGVEGSHAGGGIDPSDATAVASDILSGKTAYIATGKTTGTIPTVTASASGNVVSVPVGYIASAQTITVGTAKAAATYTPTTTDQTIAAGKYLTGAQTIKGDANLIAANIAAGVTIFGVEGTHSGGSPFDLVKVTAYTPGQPALTAVSSIALSGLGMGDMDDYSAFNGTYNVSVATEREADPLKRAFKHSTDNRYLFWIEYYETGYWVLSTSQSITDLYEAALYFSSSSALTSGTNTWYSENGDSQTVTAAVTNTNYPAISQVLTGRNVTAYNTTTQEWTISETDRNLTAFEKTPTKNGIWAATGTTLIGNRIAFSAGPVPTSGLVFYAPLDASHATAETGQTLTSSGSVSYSDDSMVLNGNGKITFDIGSSASTGTGPVTLSIWYKGTSTSNDMGLFVYGSMPFDNTVCALKIESGIAKATGWGSGSVELAAVTSVNNGAWHHIAATFTNSTAVIYIDGDQDNSGNCPINISGRDGAIGGTFWGDYSPLYGAVRAARVYSRVLTAEEIGALYAEF